MLLLQLNVTTNESIEFTQKCLSENSDSLITCIATILIGVIVRVIEKRKMKKSLNEKP